MANNVAITAGAGTTIAADDIAGVFYQRIKLVSGTEDSTTAIDSGNGVAAGALRVTLASDSTGTTAVTNAGTFAVQAVGSIAHDAGGTSTNPVLVGGFASAAVPTDVSADGDAVRTWHLRSGAMAVQPTLGGVLASVNNGASGTGVQRVTIANDSTGVLAAVTNVATIGTSVTPGTGATHLGKAEDAVHTNGDTGVMALAVRNDAGTALAGTTGDYIPLTTDSTGALRVVGSTATTQYAEDAVAASGDSLVIVGAVRRDTAASSSGTDGDYSTLNTNSTGALRVTIDSYGSGSAAAPSTDGVGAFPATNSIMNGTTALTPKFAAIAASTSGDNTLVAAVTSKKIRVIKLFIFGGAAGNIYFKTGGGGVIFGGSTNKINLAINQGFVLPGGDVVGWFETVSGEALVMNASSTGPFSGGVVYIEV